MTGGECFLLEADERLLNDELVALVEPAAEDQERLLRLLDRHRRATGSERAAALLEDTAAALSRFRRVVPRALLVDGRLEGRLSA
jgi:glutamate synthase (NADPH/NADH) large chain